MPFFPKALYKLVGLAKKKQSSAIIFIYLYLEKSPMTTLVACLSTGKGTWGHVNRLIEDEDWSKVILLTNEYGKENFNANEKTELAVINMSAGLKELSEEIHTVLKEKVKDLEIGLNFVSGTGKEHMALMGAIMKLGIGFRLIALTQKGVEEI